MDYENYDLSFPDQPVVDQYLPLWAKLPAFRSKPAFIWIEDDATKVLTINSTLNYAQLNDSVQSISLELLVPLQRGDTVVILCSPGLELVEIIFGRQRADLLSVPVLPPDSSFGNENYHHLVRVLTQTNPRAAIAHHGYISSVKHYISYSSKDKKLAELLENLRWISTEDIKGKMSTGSSLSYISYNGCKQSEVYLIQYTSGATGIPKPVLVTAGSAAHNVRMARKAYDLHPNSVIVSCLRQYQDCGLMFLLMAIVSGATCVLKSPGAFIARSRLWLELITEFKATCTPVPSFTLPLVVKRGGVEDFVNVFRQFGLNPSSIFPSYGLAENCTFVSTAWRNNTNSANIVNFPSHKKLIPSARLPSKGGEEEEIHIMVVNEDKHEPVEDGVKGEIWVSSPSNASGYLGHPFLTLEVFQKRLRNNLSQCFVRTGDRGIIKGEERFLFITGRYSDIIKLPNNQEIHPHCIETAAYNSCPQHLRGGCLAAFMTSTTIVLVAEMQRTGEVEKIVLRNGCERIRQVVVDEEKVELGLVVLVRSGSVPKTTSGKVQRWAAKLKFIQGRMSAVMEMRFDERCNSSSFRAKVHGSRGKGKGGDGRK